MPSCDPRPRRERRPRRLSSRVWARLAAIPLLALLAGGCDLPTSLPRWDTQWLIPVRNTSLSVAQLLPSSVSIASDNSAFLASVAPVTMSRSLGELCSACTASAIPVPKPAFTATVADTLRLPADVASATLAGGTVAVSITNGFGFDPIRPSAAARGSLTVTMASGSSPIGTLTLDGTTDALPANSTVERTVTLSGAAIGGKIAVQLIVDSPAGDPVRIDPGQRFSLRATPQSIRLSDVTVAVSQKRVTVQPVELNVGDIDPSLIDRVKAGALVLDIANPFNVAGNLTITIAGPSVNITRPIQLLPGNTAPRVQFTQQEIQSILGRSGVTLAATGLVSAIHVDTLGAVGVVRVAPSQAVQVNAQLELTLGSKEN